jgi:hypothetical protein
MKALPFIPSVSEIVGEDFDLSPELSGAVAHWTDGCPDPAGWLEEVRERWGGAGLIARRGDEALGFALYGPPEYFPRVARYSVSPPGEGAVLLADVEGDARIRKQLLVRVLRDLKQRGCGPVEAVAGLVSLPHHVESRFLLENGWEVVRRQGVYALMRVELDNAVEVGDLARGLLERMKLPVISRSPSPALRARSHRGLSRVSP